MAWPAAPCSMGGRAFNLSQLCLSIVPSWQSLSPSCHPNFSLKEPGLTSEMLAKGALNLGLLGHFLGGSA
jgi:hypothetical protein